MRKNNSKLFSEDSSIFDDIRSWASKRGIYHKGDSKTQFVKLCEEVGELARAVNKRDDGEFYDAVGDSIVVLTNLVKLYEQERVYIESLNNKSKFIDSEHKQVEDCLLSAYEVIKERTGKMENGTFVKD